MVTSRKGAGFTLIELSIVLVIIGLIVGGVLVGQDLIRAAGVRATITQVEKFNTAVNTFYGKYGALPGDLNQRVASTFGFAARGQYAGEGDGNGIIEGIATNAAGSNGGTREGVGETAMFWVDLNQAHLIGESFNTASSTNVPNAPIVGSSIDSYIPQAKLGRGSYIYVYSGSYLGNSSNQNGTNYFGISAVTQILDQACGACIDSNSVFSVQEAYSIDKKVDDGLPQTGRVTALYLNEAILWAGTGGYWDSNGPYTTGTAGSSTTCYDNGNISGNPQQYSVEISNGSNVNCALSFQFQ